MVTDIEKTVFQREKALEFRVPNRRSNISPCELNIANAKAG